MKLSVIGLGKLGLCTAACFACKGFTVKGFDVNPFVMERLAKGEAPISETGIASVLEKAGPNLSLVQSISQAVLDSDAIFIIVPTPSKEDFLFDNQYVIRVLEEAGKALGKKSGFHIVSVVSTVVPGSCDTVFLPLLEKLSGKKCGRDFGLVYNPEFIALGSVIHDFLNPDMVLIGASDPYSGEKIAEIYKQTCDNTPDIRVMSPVNAEITKLVNNCFVTTKISFANSIAALCEKVPGADVDEITRAMGSDSRIGPKCLKAGLGFGGPCFPRDNEAILAFGQTLGITRLLGSEVIAINQDVVSRMVGAVEKRLQPGSKVALIGLSYKPDTHIVERSHSLEIAAALLRKGFQVSAWNPKPVDRAEVGCFENLELADTPYRAAENAGAVLLCAMNPEEISWEKMAEKACSGAWLIDCWRIYKNAPPTDFQYWALGMGNGGSSFKKDWSHAQA